MLLDADRIENKRKAYMFSELWKAKWAVDRIWYLAKHLDRLKAFVDIRDEVESRRQTFYLQLRIVIDKSVPDASERKKLKKTDGIIKAIYYEADKRYAHHDEDYIAPKWGSLSEMVMKMQNEITHVKSLIEHLLPQPRPLDFYPFCSKLFRIEQLMPPNG